LHKIGKVVYDRAAKKFAIEKNNIKRSMPKAHKFKGIIGLIIDTFLLFGNDFGFF
jgi:hypothetical protein